MKINLNRTIISNMLLVMYVLYMIDPFFINSIASINRVIYYIFAIMPILYNFIKHYKLMLNVTTHMILKGIVILVIWSFGISCIISHDFGYFIDLIKLLFKVIAGIGIYLIWKDKYIKKKITWSYERIFSYAVLLYIISSIVFIIYPYAKEFWVNLIYNDRQPMYIILDPSYATRYGLAGWSSFGEAYMVIFGVISIIVMQMKKEISLCEFSILNMFMLIGTFLYGRYAMAIVFLIIIIYGIYLLFAKRNLWLFNILAVCLGIGVYFILLLYNYNDSTRLIIEWAMEPIISFLETGSFSVNSTAQLEEMYISFSPSAMEIITGVGRWYEASGLPYGLTDVGFMRNLYFGGFAFCIFVYGLDIYVAYKCAMSITSVRSSKKILFVFLLIIIISADLKGSMTITFLRYVIPLLLANRLYERCIDGK